MASDLGNNLNLDELDYDDDGIEDEPSSIKSRESSPEHKSDDDGEIQSSDDGEIKSESEDGEINDSDSEGLAPKSEEEPSIFPPKKKPDLPPVRENNTHIDREKPLCRYYKQGYCQYGNRCHFLHSRPNMVNIVPESVPEINKGNYELFKTDDIVKPTRKITPIQPTKSVHIGLHRPPPPKPTGETSWEKGLKKVRTIIHRRDMIKRGELLPTSTEPVEKDESDDKKNGTTPPVQTRTVVTSKSKRARIERVPSQSPESDIKREIENYVPYTKIKKKNEKGNREGRWDQAKSFMDEKPLLGKKGRTRQSSDSDSSSSSSSSSSAESSDSFSSESSGRKTPKGYRRNGASHRRSSSEDEDYRRTRRLEAKAKTIPAAKKSAKTDYRVSSSSKKSKSSSKRPNRKRPTSSSSSTTSSDSDSTSSDRSSRSEKKRMKLQKQLKQVEAALKAKRGKNRKK